MRNRNLLIVRRSIVVRQSRIILLDHCRYNRCKRVRPSSLLPRTRKTGTKIKRRRPLGAVRKFRGTILDLYLQMTCRAQAIIVKQTRRHGLRHLTEKNPLATRRKSIVCRTPPLVRLMKFYRHRPMEEAPLDWNGVHAHYRSIRTKRTTRKQARELNGHRTNTLRNGKNYGNRTSNSASLLVHACNENA